MEPSRCCISSIALVLLKTGIVHTTNASGERQVSIDYNQMATAQKLLLFWRKPAVRYYTPYGLRSNLTSVAAQVLVGRHRGRRRGARRALESHQALGAPGLDSGAQLGAYLSLSLSAAVLLVCAFSSAHRAAARGQV